jgi:hypothetical protein
LRGFRKGEGMVAGAPDVEVKTKSRRDERQRTHGNI